MTSAGSFDCLIIVARPLTQKSPHVPHTKTQNMGASVVLTKAPPGYAGGEKELIARGGVDKKKSPS